MKAIQRPRSVQLLGRGGSPRPDDEIKTVGAQRDGPHVFGGGADDMAPVMAHEHSHQWCHSIPEPEHQSDLHGTAPAQRKPPEGNRRAEVVQAEGKSEDEKTADHRVRSTLGSATPFSGVADSLNRYSVCLLLRQCEGEQCASLAC